ncbi:MAG: hypothetical protein WDA22_17495 [Bacteroidota bacterium]
MNTYILPIVLIIIAFVQYSRNQIINKFFYTDTLSPESAKQFKDIGVTDLPIVKVLLFRGILKAAGNNKYYLDLERKYEIEKAKEKYLIGLIILATVFLIVAVAVLYFR